MSETRLNIEQTSALETMYQCTPAVQAARAVLSGHLLSGGIGLRKNGEYVLLEAAFKSHLNDIWLPFAQDVVDSFLKFGYVVIAYDEHVERARVQHGASDAAKKRKRPSPTFTIPIVPMLGSYEVAFQQSGALKYKREYMVYPHGHCRGEEDERGGAKPGSKTGREEGKGTRDGKNEAPG